MKRNFRKLSMNLTLPEIAGIVWLCFLIILPVKLDAQTPAFDQLKLKFEEGNIFNAVFTHEYEDSYTGEHSQNQGEIWIGKDSYRVEGDEQIMIVDGEISRVYDGIRNRLLISDYDEEEDDFAPSRMLQGVDDSYSIGEESLNSGTLITLTTDDPFAIFISVEITLDGNGNPVVIRAVDQVDNLLTTRFETGRFQEADPELFEMEVPGNAERIDLRH
jgi:outer membrane lipoprotein-sorting protein